MPHFVSQDYTPKYVYKYRQEKKEEKMPILIHTRDWECTVSQERLESDYIKLNIADLKGVIDPLPPDNIEFYLSESENRVVAGIDVTKDESLSHHKNGLYIVARLNFLRRKCLDHLYQNERQVIESRSVDVNGRYRRKHIALAMYMFLLHRGYVVIAGSVQPPSLGLLYKSLDNDYEQIKTDIVNTGTGVILKRDHKIRDFIDGPDTDEVWSGECTPETLGWRHALRLSGKEEGRL